MSTITFVVALFYFGRALLFGTNVLGWTSLFVTMLFMSSFQIALMGILGIYLGKTFDEARRRPLYIVKETINLNLPVQPQVFQRSLCAFPSKEIGC
jgi:hypothetical protein